ncbi:5-oxoprolinase subunit PxpB [uncultured Microbulbifer sp.]|uniref:5-oxoprolinase subunit PxpB n=1 Tax=uncultured Microbulbifer sp. TaxID=348147 RepID=UPI0025D8F5EC|nr:5-oxoprolinase subunit PxpB [uncultured Microbulbifer sp.]
MKADFTLKPNGDAALDICFSAPPSAALSETIMLLAQAIEAASIPAVSELVPAYQCLTVCFDPLQLAPVGSHGTAHLRRQLAQLTERALSSSRTLPGERFLIRIPVCYEKDFAPDMSALRQHTGLATEEIIQRHTNRHYLVHMLGFTPGFLYLGGLDERLHCPRKSRPELRVPAGSVGIGGAQTGIYPQATPGGWQIIGRTPLALFRPEKTFAFVARPLDYIQFVPISADVFARYVPGAEIERTLIGEVP